MVIADEISQVAIQKALESVGVKVDPLPDTSNPLVLTLFSDAFPCIASFRCNAVVPTRCRGRRCDADLGWAVMEQVTLVNTGEEAIASATEVGPLGKRVDMVRARWLVSFHARVMCWKEWDGLGWCGKEWGRRGRGWR